MDILEAAIKDTKEQFTPGNSNKLSEEKEVIDRYGKIFSLSNIDNLQWEKFHDLLLHSKNHHWPNIQISSGALKANFDKLKIALKILLNEDMPIRERLMKTVSGKGENKVPGLGPAVATAILTVAFPKKYSVYNGLVEKAVNLIQHKKYSTNHFVEQYEDFNKYANDLAKQHGISLWELDWVWLYITKHPEENIDIPGYQNALKRIIYLYGEINKNCEILVSKEEVLSKYQKLFSPSNIKNLEKDEFVEFLPFKSNHHWSGLQRQAKNLTSDMGALRKALSELLDDSKSIKDRIDNMVRFKNMTHLKGLDSGIYTPILMITSNQKFAVQNKESEGFLSEYGIKPEKKHKTDGEYYEELNDIFNRLAKDAKIDLWTLDALFHYNLYIGKVREESKRRKDLWDNMSKNPDGKVPLSELSQAKLPIAQRGAFNPQDSGLGERVSLRILITDTQYNNIIEEGGLNYESPYTEMQQQDEIEGMISAMNYRIPIFVIISNRNDKESRKVKIGLVREYNEVEKTFLVDVFDQWPGQQELVFKTEDEQETEFDPYSKDTNRKEALIETRPGQAKFKFDVVKKYGAKCAVCGVALKEVLEAAHIVPKSEGGADDSQNGLILCANHHRMFDSNLFTIGTDYKLEYRKGYNKDNLMIKVEDLSSFRNRLHSNAIRERYKMFKKVG